MEEKIQLIRQRNFSDTINDTLKFLRLNVKLILQALLLVLPLAFLGSWFFSGYFDFVSEMAQHPGAEQVRDGIMAQLPKMGLGMLALMAGGIVQALSIIKIFTLYEQSEDGRIESSQLFGGIGSDFFRFLGFNLALIGLAWLVMIVLIGLVAVAFVLRIIPLGVLLIFALYFVIIYLAVAVCFAPFAYMRERNGVMNALKRSLFLIKGYWWQTFGVLLVMYFIVGFANMIFAIPFYSSWMNKMFESARTGVVDIGFSDTDKMWLMLMMTASSVLSSFIYVALIFQYYTLIARKEGEPETSFVSDAPNQLYE